MNIPIKEKNNIPIPPVGYGYLFIDYESKELKCKKDTGEIIKFNTGDNIEDITLLDLCDYSAFEIYAHDTPINVGPLSGTVHENFIGKSDDNIVFKVNPSMTESFTIRSEQGINEQNVIVDWGDGTAVKLCELEEPIFNGEYRYVLTHTYDKVGTYIIKIFGTSYFSFMGSNDPNTTLISRIFDYDLPIASHIWNLSSCCIHAQRLLRFNMYSHSASKNIKHFSKAFTSCRNLIEAFGFAKYNGDRYTYSIFNNCGGLKSTDLSLSVTPLTTDGNAHVFEKCSNLTADINDLLPIQGFKSGSTIDLNKTFRACYLLSGTVPADKLWNDKTINWINISSTFESANEEIRSQVPVSWGGTNKYIDFQLKHKDESDFTAFEVFAHDYDIVKGTKVKDTALSACILTDELLEETFLHDVPASMMHVFAIRSKQTEDINDIEIDWGDQTGQSLSEAKLEVIQSGSEFIYLVGHTYTTNGFYKVSIYGKNYFSFCNQSPYKWTSGDYTNNTIMCRVLSDDLPVASCVSNFSSLARTNRHILEIKLSNKINMLNAQLTYSFKSCLNLLRATGFGMSLSLYSAYDCFNSCGNLLYTDLSLQFSCKYSAINRGVFGHCKRLELNIANVFPSTGFVGNNVDVYQLFLNCQKMTGTVPANKLWNNKNINWTNTGSTFSGCSAEIRSQVPVSWGGTNKNIDIELKITDEMKNDYSAFEVYAHTEPIKVGLLSGTIHENLMGKSDDSIKIAVPASTIHAMYIRSKVTQDKQDVIVDWGDGTFTQLSDITPVAAEDNEYNYYLHHDYLTALGTEKSGKFIIKIFGKSYFSFVVDNTFNENGMTNTQCSLISRIFTQDLPLASWIWNVSGMCQWSLRLLHVDFYDTNIPVRVKHWSATFRNCRNMIDCTGFTKYSNRNYINSIFNACYNLKNTDLILIQEPVNAKGLSQTFSNCKSLIADINDLIPAQGFRPGCTIDATSLFENAINISGTIPADKLWNDKNITWTNTTKVFAGCSDEIRTQAPISWGGTAPDSIIVNNDPQIIKYEFEITDENTETVSFTKEQLGIQLEFEFDILDKDGYNITTDIRLKRRWIENKYEITMLNGFNVGKYTLKTFFKN